MAASIFALWQFKNEAEADYLASSSSSPSSPPSPSQPFLTAAQGELDLQGHVVAFNGSVIEQYPRYLQNCQGYLDDLVSSSSSSTVEGEGKPATISLVGAKESSLLGAAVALACLEEGKAN